MTPRAPLPRGERVASESIGPWSVERTLARRARTGLFACKHRDDGRSASIRAPLAGIDADARVREELAREGRVLTQLGWHEAILALAADESASSPPRLVLEGGDLVVLAEMLVDGLRGLDAALALVLPLADALAEAHAMGVVHGRLSPSCVLVSRRGTPKLAMFADAPSPRGAGARAPETALDDPAWLAPELVMGDDVSPAADVYGLACLFVEVAAGHHPFAGEHAASDDGKRLGFAASLARIRDELGPMLPAAAAAALTRALSRHPGERQRDAAELAADLLRSLPAARAASPLADARGGGRSPAAARAPDDEDRSRVSIAPFAVIATVLFVACAVLLGSGGSAREAGAPAPGASGRLRILARPWANVALDGAPLDVTPIGEPVAVSPGRHVVDFVHPSAPKVQRVVEVTPGQTVVVDVILDVPQPAPSASVDASP